MKKTILLFKLIYFYLKKAYNSDFYRRLFTKKKFKNSKTRKKVKLEKVEDTFDVESIKLSDGSYAITLNKGGRHLNEKFKRLREQELTAEEREKFRPSKRSSLLGSNPSDALDQESNNE